MLISKEDNTGTLAFGSVDDTLYTGELINVPVANGTDEVAGGSMAFLWGSAMQLSRNVYAFQ